MDHAARVSKRSHLPGSRVLFTEHHQINSRSNDDVRIKSNILTRGRSKNCVCFRFGLSFHRHLRCTPITHPGWSVERKDLPNSRGYLTRLEEQSVDVPAQQRKGKEIESFKWIMSTLPSCWMKPQVKSNNTLQQCYTWLSLDIALSVTAVRSKILLPNVRTVDILAFGNT